MKKNPIIFIAMLIALAFTSCQMNTDDSVVISPTYEITVTATNGTVTLSKTEAKAGEKVFVESIEAANGYTAEGLEQTFQSKDGKTLTLDFGTEDGKRYFVMPECNVVITVTFKATPPAPTYTITVTGDQTNGSAKVTNASGKEITSAKAGENVTLIVTPKSGYKFDATIIINGQSETQTDSAERSYTMAMPSSNITVNVSFTQISNNNGEDNNGEPPATTNEYTVSVASGIKGGHIEVSLDNATWTTLSTSTNYAKNTKLYVRAVADKHYEYKDGLRTDGLEGQLKYIVLNSNAELNANFVIKNESLTPGSLTFGKKYTDVSSYRLKIMVKIAQSEFSESYKDARLAFGFSDGFYGINKRIGSTSTDKYFYVYDTVIPYDTFENVNNSKRIFVAINLDNAYELPDGEIYVLFPNLKNSEEKSVMYKATKDNDGDYVVDLENYYPKYYFDASQL